MKQYPIHSVEDFSKMVKQFMSYFVKREEAGLDFQSINIISKRYRKSKTPEHHKYYFRCINELQKGFKNAGYEYTKENIHEFVKHNSGFTTLMRLPSGKTVEVTKSIADKSEDATTEEVTKLCDFIKRFAAKELNWIIED